MSSTVRQKTLKNAIGCSGVGLHTGIQVTMMICHAEAVGGSRGTATEMSGGPAWVAGTWRTIIESKLG